MQQTSERQQLVRREARRYGLLVGYAGGILAVLQVSAGGAAAFESQPTALSLQRSLVNLSLGGGANPIPSVQQLGPMWTLVGGMCFLIFCATLWLCGVAGRLAATATGERGVGRTAGSRTALVTSGIWILVSLLAAGVFHVDGGFSWVIATVAVLTVSPATHVPNVLFTAPDSQFVVAHLVTLSITHVIALLITWGFGAIAGNIGASTAPRHALPATNVLPPYGMPPYAVPLYLPPVGAYPSQTTPFYPPMYPPQYPQYPQYPQHPQYPQYPQYPPAQPPQQPPPPAAGPSAHSDQ